MVKRRDIPEVERGFEARLYVDDSCNKTLLELYRNRQISRIGTYFTVPHTYVYTKDVGNSRNVSILAPSTYPGWNVLGARLALWDGVFQISDTPCYSNSISNTTRCPSEMWTQRHAHCHGQQGQPDYAQQERRYSSNGQNPHSKPPTRMAQTLRHSDTTSTLKGFDMRTLIV